MMVGQIAYQQSHHSIKSTRANQQVRQHLAKHGVRSGSSMGEPMAVVKFSWLDRWSVNKSYATYSYDSSANGLAASMLLSLFLRVRQLEGHQLFNSVRVILPMFESDRSTLLISDHRVLESSSVLLNQRVFIYPSKEGFQRRIVIFWEASALLIARN